MDERVENLPTSFDALHWHGDTFDIPEGGSNFMTSEGTANQGFVYGDSTLALQFHLEMLPSHVQQFIKSVANQRKRVNIFMALKKCWHQRKNFSKHIMLLDNFLEAFIFQKETQLIGE